MHATRYIREAATIITQKLNQMPNDDNGKIYISFHYGVFELAPVILSIYLKTTVYVVVDALTISRQSRLSYYKALIKKDFQDADIEFILVQDFISMRKLLKILKNKGIVFIYFDENKSINEENKNFVSLPFIFGFNYLVKTSIPYFLKKTPTSIYSVITNIQHNNIDFEIREITNSNAKEYSKIFYEKCLDLLKSGLEQSPHQWTRWYNVDELDESSSDSLSKHPADNYLRITDHNSQRKYVIDINLMKIKEIHE
ncbi:MAG: hypothetical protein AB7W47_17425 [Calditrichaceae bacterium]